MTSYLDPLGEGLGMPSLSQGLRKFRVEMRPRKPLRGHLVLQDGPSPKAVVIHRQVEQFVHSVLAVTVL